MEETPSSAMNNPYKTKNVARHVEVSFLSLGEGFKKTVFWVNVVVYHTYYKLVLLCFAQHESQEIDMSTSVDHFEKRIP